MAKGSRLRRVAKSGRIVSSLTWQDPYDGRAHPRNLPMSEHYPRLRIAANTGLLVVRESVAISFYMQRQNLQVAPLVVEAMEKYAILAGLNLGRYADNEGEWQDLDAAGWAHVRRQILEGISAGIHLNDVSGREQRYRFRYHGNSLD